MPPLGHAGENTELVMGYFRSHDRQSGPLEVFGVARTNAHADGADPLLDSRLLAQIGQDAGHVLGQQVGGIDEAEDILAVRPPQPIGARLDRVRPVLGGGCERP